MDTGGHSVSPELLGLPEVLTWGNRRSDKGRREWTLSTRESMGRCFPSPCASSNLLEPESRFQEES